MVKGVTRRVVVLKSPEPKLYEQAIFLLREDGGQGDDPSEQVLREAQQVANDYLQRASPEGKRQRRLEDVMYTLFGGGLATCLWLLLSQFL